MLDDVNLLLSFSNDEHFKEAPVNWQLIVDNPDYSFLRHQFVVIRGACVREFINCNPIEQREALLHKWLHALLFFVVVLFYIEDLQITFKFLVVFKV